MKFNRFRLMLVSRVLLLTTTIFAFLFLVQKTELLVLSFALGGACIIEISWLIHYVEKTNRDLCHFLKSIELDDFSQTFGSTQLGDSFKSLANAFNNVRDNFLHLRSEKEQHFFYLQTVVQHVSVGMISFKSDGEVELMNRAAQEILGIKRLNNIKMLSTVSPQLVETISGLKTGQSSLLKLKLSSPAVLSIKATEFKLKEVPYTLLSLQNIQGEIEREQLVKELEIAGEVQKSLLPEKSPQLQGYDIAAMCTPAKEVGGDYFDYIDLGNNKLAVIIGDVSGKGIHAAFYMTLTKGFIQSNIKAGINLRDSLSDVNSLTLKSLNRNSFVTLFIAVIDGHTGDVECVRAGHTPALHYSSDQNTCRTIKPKGIALGMTQRKTFFNSIETYHFKLKKHDWLILYTDGLNEAMNSHGEEFGEDRLIQAIQDNKDNQVHESLSDLFNRIKEFSGTAEQFDDMTIIGIKVL